MAQTFGFIMLVFAVGCIVGPTVGGILRDTTGTLSAALIFGLGTTILAALAALALKRPSKL